MNLKDLHFNQEKFNSLISKLISNMSLDENIDEEEKKDEENEGMMRNNLNHKIKSKKLKIKQKSMRKCQ